MSDKAESVGKPLDRVDGRLKVTGGAKYAAEFQIPDLAHAVMIMSAIPSGRVTSMDIADAERLPGVIRILTPFNAPRLGPKTDSPQDGSANQKPSGAAARPQGRVLTLLQDEIVRYNNQPVGVVVAETFEQASEAANRVRVHYAEQPPKLDFGREKKRGYAPRQANRDPADTSRGDFDRGLSAADSRIDEIYTTPMENHNPMEPHATIAVWDGDHLTVYDSTQGIFGVQSVLAQVFSLPPANVRCVTYFTGGGFGCKGSVWSHTPLAAMAAREIGRPVKLEVTRAQMFGMVGFRPRTEQHIQLGATNDGSLTASRHDCHSQTSTFDEFVEPSAVATRMLYAVPNQETSHRLVRLNYGTPTYMRAPGESSGTYAIETAMDELACALKMDPVALRLKNYAETDPDKNLPWSSKSLRECYRVAGERFGWEKRNPEPRSMRAPDGRLMGWGMATATYPMNRSQSTAMARLLPDGSAYVTAGTQDLGTGTYTIMTQIAADALGLPPERVRFELGDTDMPRTPGSGGSMTAASTGSAVKAAGLAARGQAIALAVADSESPLYGLATDAVDSSGGRLFSRSEPSRGESYADIMARQKLPKIEARGQSGPDAEAKEYSMHSFGSVFTEALVDPDLGEIRLNRIVAAYGAGKILNAKTARSQFIGGIIFGIGMALLEQSVPDPRYGNIVNRDLGEYHVPINADVPPIDVISVDEIDPHVNPIGAKGIGEIGITGICASIGNAVYHATGTRVRSLPITLDRLI